MMKATGKSNAERTQEFHRRRDDIQRLRSVAMANVGTGSVNPPSDSQSSTSSAESSRNSTGEEDTDVCCEGSSGGGIVFGHVSMIGRRRVMEDAVAVAPPVLLAEEYTFFAVYDGHGGAMVAEKCREKLHKCLEKHVVMARESAKEKGFDWERVMVESFRSMDEELELVEGVLREEMAAAERQMGSTATVVLVGKEEVVVANCGDSRAVLYRGGVVVPLSRDHKPDREDEKRRIEAAGGRVINWNGWRVEGVLATSRSLGDQYLKPYVCSEPEVTIIRRSESDEFIIIGTDGLFDVVCNEGACNAVRQYLTGQRRKRKSRRCVVSEAAGMLAELAIAKGSKDNVSVIVVQMK